MTAVLRFRSVRDFTAQQVVGHYKRGAVSNRTQLSPMKRSMQTRICRCSCSRNHYQYYRASQLVERRSFSIFRCSIQWLLTSLKRDILLMRTSCANRTAFLAISMKRIFIYQLHSAAIRSPDTFRRKQKMSRTAIGTKKPVSLKSKTQRNGAQLELLSKMKSANSPRTNRYNNQHRTKSMRSINEFITFLKRKKNPQALYWTRKNNIATPYNRVTIPLNCFCGFFIHWSLLVPKVDK